MAQQFSAKLTPGIPGPPGPPGPITPWTSNIDAAGYQLLNLARAGVGNASPNYGIDVVGDINVSGHYYRSGVQLSINTQNVATASRAPGTVYNNNTGKTMFVLTCWNLGGKNSTIDVLSDSANPPTTQVAEIADQSTSVTTVQLFFLVLPGNNYLLSIAAGTPTLVAWTEYT
jgi:hypothetical protein